MGSKIIVTDALLRDNALDIWAVVGKQVGDAAARKLDRDIMAVGERQMKKDTRLVVYISAQEHATLTRLPDNQAGSDADSEVCIGNGNGP